MTRSNSPSNTGARQSEMKTSLSGQTNTHTRTHAQGHFFDTHPGMTTPSTRSCDTCGTVIRPDSGARASCCVRFVNGVDGRDVIHAFCAICIDGLYQSACADPSKRNGDMGYDTPIAASQAMLTPRQTHGCYVCKDALSATAGEYLRTFFTHLNCTVYLLVCDKSTCYSVAESRILRLWRVSPQASLLAPIHETNCHPCIIL